MKKPIAESSKTLTDSVFGLTKELFGDRCEYGEKKKDYSNEAVKSIEDYFKSLTLTDLKKESFSSLTG